MSEVNDWIFEAVVGFLHCPIWKTPVLTFIEQQCLVFDPEDENKLAYTEVHKKYQDLVELLLTSFVEDIGIKAETFVQACMVHTEKYPQSTLTLFEQVEAAQDFNVFKRMMIQKNIELELQALQMIQQRNGVVPEILQPTDKTNVKYSQAVLDTDEERTLQEVIRLSKEEYEAQKARESKEINKDLDKAIANSKDDIKRLEAEKRREDELLEKALAESKDAFSRCILKLEREKTLMDETLKLKISSEEGKTLKPIEKKSSADIKQDLIPPPSSAKSPTPANAKSPTPSTTSKSSAVSGAEAAANWMTSAKAEAAADSRSSSRASATSNTSSNEIKRREEYLKQQRDRLLAMKKKEREKNLVDFTQKEAKSRPKSARVAKEATSGGVDKVSGPSTEEQEKKLAMRRALADRLKQEVINKT